MGSLNPPSFRFPFPLHGQPEEVQQAHIFAFNAILDLQSANKEVSAQIAALKTAAITPGTSTSTITKVVGSSFPGLGTANDQTGNTTYTTQTGDNGALLIFNDASPVAVGLNSVVSTPFFLFVTNFGAGTATLTPTSGLINGGASFALPQNYFAFVVFDGTNWETSALLPMSVGPNFVENEILGGGGTAWTFAHAPISSLPASTSVALYVQQYNGGPFVRLPPTAITSIIGNAMVTAASWTAGALMADYRY